MSDAEEIIVVIDEDLEDLIPGFMENRVKDVESLSNALEGKDLKNLQAIGHSLKGVGGGYGFHEISRLGAAIESSAKEESFDEISQFVLELDSYLKHVQIKFE